MIKKAVRWANESKMQKALSATFITKEEFASDRGGQKKNPLLVTLLNESSQHTRGAPELVCQFNRGHRSDPNDCLDALQINAGLRLGGRGGSLRPKRGSTQHDTSLQSAGDGLMNSKGRKEGVGGRCWGTVSDFAGGAGMMHSSGGRWGLFY